MAATQKNKIVFWDETPGVPEYQQSTGRSMGSNLYYNAIGIFQDAASLDKYPHWDGAQPGDVIFEDVNKDGKIDGLDLVRNERNSLPRFTGGFTLSLQYKNLRTDRARAGCRNYMATCDPNPETTETITKILPITAGRRKIRAAATRVLLMVVMNTGVIN